MSETSTRQYVYARSEGSCEVCGNWPGTNVHHRLNRSQGGDWSSENCIHVCGSGTRGCHGWITSHPNQSRDNGWLVSRTERSLDVPLLYRHRWALLNDNGAVIELE